MGNRLCTLGFLGLHCTPFPYKSHMLKRLQQIPRIQWVAWRTVPVTGAGAVHGRQCTIPVAIRWPIIPIPLHVEDRQALKHTDSGAKQGQKGSVMHRFRGYRGKLDAKEIQTPPRFPRLRGCTRPIVNSWVKFFPWGTGEGVPFWARQAKSTCGHSTGGRIDLEGGHTLRAGSYSGPAVVARSRVGPSIKFGQIY